MPTPAATAMTLSSSQAFGVGNGQKSSSSSSSSSSSGRKLKNSGFYLPRLDGKDRPPKIGPLDVYDDKWKRLEDHAENAGDGPTERKLYVRLQFERSMMKNCFDFQRNLKKKAGRVSNQEDSRS